MRRVLILLALLASAAPAPAADAGAGGFDLEALMHRLGAVKASRAYFSERKILHMLNEPLDSSGTLAYVAPDKLDKRTLLPKPEELSVDGDTLVVERGGEASRTLSLSDNPEIGAFVESIRATLAGDLPALERHYRVSLEGTEAEWRMVLEPKDRRLADLVKWIRFSGRDDRIRSIESEEGDGDRSEMRIVDTGR